MSSRLQVNNIQSLDGGAPTLSGTVEIPSGKEVVITGAGVSVVGILTAQSFVGDGSNMTNLTTISIPQVLAYKRILGFDEFQAK